MALSEQLLCDDHRVVNVDLDEHFDYRSIHHFKCLRGDKSEQWVEVVVDMSRTRFMDSSGVALLLCLFKWIKAPHVVVRISHCSPAIRSILQQSRGTQKLLID